jgi:hypothetical protein
VLFVVVLCFAPFCFVLFVMLLIIIITIIIILTILLLPTILQTLGAFASLQAEHTQVCAKVRQLERTAAAAKKSAMTEQEYRIYAQEQVARFREWHKELQDKYSEQESELWQKEADLRESNKRMMKVFDAYETAEAKHQRTVEALKKAHEEELRSRSKQHQTQLDALRQKLLKQQQEQLEQKQQQQQEPSMALMVVRVIFG